MVLVASIAAGSRAWGMYKDQRLLSKLGSALLITATAQVILGILALVGKGMAADLAEPPIFSVIVRTAHQVTGAGLMALATMLMLWTRRLISDPA